MTAKAKRSARGGFTLIEIAVATIVVGIGLTALLVCIGSSTRVNDAGGKLAQASFLAQEIREWTLALPFSDPDAGDAHNPPGPDGSNPQVFVDDLDDLMNVPYSPPRDGMGQPITSLAGWSQTIKMSWRDPNEVASLVADGASDVVYVQVDVGFRGKNVYAAKWLVTRK